MPTQDWQPDQAHASTPQRARRRRKRAEPTAPDTRLRLESVNRLINEYAALTNPELMMLVSEDCCWQLARDEWKQRRPSIWRRAERRAWREERNALDAKSERLRELGTELGLPPRPDSRRRARFGRDGR